jgi:hypothetical protein
MHRAMWIYMPTLLLMALSVALPHVGPKLIGDKNLSEFALFLAFWWLVFAIGWRVVRRACVESRRDAPPPRGFDVIGPSDGPEDRR